MTYPELGLGLLSIGRPWGARLSQPPAREDAVDLIAQAWHGGIRFFDTAPAYNTSEAILGEALGRWPEMAAGMTIATKAGEHWVGGETGTRVDHGFDALRASIDTSLSRLGRIDILQIHKATEQTVGLDSVARAIDYARSRGIGAFGASVSTREAAQAAMATGLFGWLQFPFNHGTGDWSDVFADMSTGGLRAIVNRPFAMGAAGADGAKGRAAAFRHVLESGLPKGSVVLTGTGSSLHLAENIESFRSCLP